MDRLIVICDGGAHTIEYLHKNGVFPSAMVAETSKFQEMTPYLTQEDDILLIIKGLTDFTMAEIYVLLSKLEEFRERFKRVVIVSNIDLGIIKFDYYIYEGDLFYGSVKAVSNGGVYDLDDNGNIIEERGINKFFKKKPKKSEGYKKNPIMAQFKKYSDKRTKLMIYGKMVTDRLPSNSNSEFLEKAIAVDIYKDV